MLYKRKDQASDLCVLRVSTEARRLDGVVFADCNASSSYVRFLHPSQWRVLDFGEIYAPDWRHPNDRIAYVRHRSRKCAEVLVPSRVPPEYITGAYVASQEAAARLKALGFDLAVTIDPGFFFR
jgi:hypothetical protein